MGNKNQKHLKPVKELIQSKTDVLNPKLNENLIWLDPNVNNAENLVYQKEIKNLNKFKLFPFLKTKDCLLKLQDIKFEKTYILVSGSLSREFFEELEKIINEILICPLIIVFTSTKKLNLIKKNILSLDKFSFFDINFVFDDFFKFNNLLLSQNKYKPHHKKK